ncbi:telomere-associated protein RIF1 isoform X5 [Chiloscyllium punctatum]|uniref:telomere-associated protein RIF1 isoform X5 n=1 Tax=Chiloscyllium punctatum TaxID=137246 RepID=UPI003B63C19E
MMAAAHPVVSGLLPLLEILEDLSVSSTEQVDAYLTIASRLSGEDGKEFATAVGKQFPRICGVFKTHVSNSDSELCNAALQALGFCVFHNNISAGLSEHEAKQLIVTLCDIAIKSADKNTCTRALWVISKQNFCTKVVEKEVQNIVAAMETILTRDQQSMVVEHEALNLIIRLIEQTPVQMGETAVRWAKLILPLVVHSAPKVRLRAATALEMSLPLLLQKQQEVAGIIEPLMISKMIPELQKLFTTKNETYVLKLWPLFVKLLGKSLHRGGSFINSLLHLEELGFRSGSPVVKKIAFIAWKSLIDNFALNPDILCSAKRLRLLMQPLSSIHVRTEILGLAKLEVWWYLALRLGPQLSANFDQVCVPLLQNAFGIDGTVQPSGTPCRTAMVSPNTTPASAQKPGFPSPSPTVPRFQLNSSLSALPVMQAVQLVGVEVLLHFLVGPAVTDLVKQNKLQLSLDPLQHPLINSSSFFCKNAGTLITAVRDAFLSVGKLVEDAMLNLIWKYLISYVKNAIESGSKKERQPSEVLTLLLQALQQIVSSNAISAQKALALIEATVRGLPQKILGSPAYQVANMDLLNGTPALFLIILLFHNSLLEDCVVEERFFMILETLVEYGLSGPTCSLAFSESVLNVINQSAILVINKEHLWRMWSIVVNPLIDRVTQTNEVNQGDALEHNFSALYIALMLPINHLFSMQNFPQSTMKSLLRTWAELYKTFARCAALVATAEANICCEELSAKILSALDDATLSNLSTLDAIIHVLNVMIDCVDFSQFSKFQQKSNSPHTPTHWLTKKQEPLGNLTSLLKLLVKITDAFHELSSNEFQFETPTAGLVSIGVGIVNILSSIFNHLSLASAIKAVLAHLTGSISTFYERTSSSVNGTSKVYNTHLCNKLEKLYADILLCLQSRYTSSFDSDVLEQLSSLLSITFLHKNRQIRNQTTQFWNATFAKSTLLHYPQQIKLVLSRVKQKTPIILPGFETLELTEESSGPYSDLSEHSQFDTKVSGVQVNSFGKRESLLARAEDLKEKCVPQTPAKLKLDFSSPKMPRQERLLEEEKSIDFVFIPPEPKERILTEHQKEVLWTKRTDLPAMYNNLDASQDSHLFSQYTQSQEDNLANPAKKLGETTETSENLPQDENMETENELDTQIAIEANNENELPSQGTDQECADHEGSRMNVEDSVDCVCSGKQEEVRNMVAQSKSNCTGSESGVSSADVSGSSTSSDIISGTPQKTSSRRQSFITLEKFDPSTTCCFSNSPLVKMAQAAAEVFIPQRAEAMEVEVASQHEKSKVCREVNLSTTKTGKHGRRRQNKTERSTVENSTKYTKAPKSIKSSTIESLDAKENSTINNRDHFNKSEAVCRQDSESQTSNKQTKNSVSNEENSEITPVDLKETASFENVSSVQEKNDSSEVLTKKMLRRSSRKHLDVAVTNQNDSKEKRDDNPGKKSQNEGEEYLQNSLQHHELFKAKENDSKSLSGKSATEKSRTSKNVSQESDSTKNTPDAGNKVRPRYQTRRASQGLTEAENSCYSMTESEGSEGNPKLQDGQKKRRRSKGRTKTKELSLKNSKTKGLMEDEITVDSQVCSKNENEEVKRSEKELEVENQHDVEVMTQVEGAENLGEMHSSPMSPVLHTSVEESNIEKDLKTHNPAQNPKEQPETIENVKTELYLEPDKTEEAFTVVHVHHLPYETGVLSADCSNLSDRQLSVKKSQKSDECHVRSKRTRKTKNCDCCKGSSQHGKLQLENKESSTKQEPESDQKEDTLHLSSSINYSSTEKLLESPRFNNTVNDGPCAFSTPLSGDSKIQFFGGSLSTVTSEVDLTEERKVIPRIETSAGRQEAEEPSAGRQEAEEPSAGRQEAEEPSAGRQEAEEPSAGRQEAEEPSAGRQEAGEPSAGRQEAGEPSAGRQEAEEPSAGRQEAEEPSAGRQELSREEMAVNDSSVEQKVLESSTGAQVTGGSSVEQTAVPESSSTEQEMINSSFTEQKVVQESSTEQKAEEYFKNGGNEQVKSVKEDVGTVELSMSEGEPVSNDVALIKDEPLKSKESLAGYELDQDQPSTTGVTIPSDGVTTVQAETDQMGRPSVPIPFDKENVQDEPVTAEHFKDAETIGTEETSPEVELTTQVDVSKPISAHLMESPQKTKNDASFLVGSMHSPSEMQACCVWSPTASPSTSILKKGIKRPSENDSPSPMTKIRRVSFADPIQREGLADDIDRRSPVVRSHSSSGSSPGLNYAVTNGCSQPNNQSKYNTTPTKGFLSPSARSSGYKSSKKCLISEMSKEPAALSTAAVYPALISCSLPVETILPQLASNMWARGLGQLVRAKNIKTIGDLSSLTAAEIKLLPIRSPKVFVVKKALKSFYEQQKKSLGLDEDNVFENEKIVNGMEDSSYSNVDDEKLATDLVEPGPSATTPSTALVSEVNALSARFFSENLNEHSGSQLFAMHQQLSSMMNCIMGNLRSRWRSPPHEAAD